MHVTENGDSIRNNDSAIESATIKARAKQARMAKSADAADLKSAGSNPVGVQVPLWAPDYLYWIKLLRVTEFLVCRFCVGIDEAVSLAVQPPFIPYPCGIADAMPFSKDIQVRLRVDVAMPVLTDHRQSLHDRRVFHNDGRDCGAERAALEGCCDWKFQAFKFHESSC